MSECTCGAKPDTAHATNCNAFIHWVTLERDRLREETAKQAATIERQDAVIEVARRVVKLENWLIVTELIDELSITLAALGVKPVAKSTD